MTTARLGRHRLPAIAVVLLLSVLAVGLALRLSGLDRRTITHAEVYVPRIEMPDYVTAPPPRSTLGETVLGTLHHDNHPPGYYAFMWVWTGLFGTGLIAIRLPSALVGAATIALLFWMARPKDGTFVALTAAALLALHGHHLLWSQQARMWVFLAFLGVLSVLLLQSLHRRFRWPTAAAYVFAVSLGLWLEYSFWPFVAAQVAWGLARSCGARHMPATVDLQVLALVLSSPALAFLKVHLAMERTGYLARADVFDHLTGFLLLQWLLPGPAPPEKLGPLVSIALLALLVAGSALLIAGVAASRANDEPQEDSSAGPRVPIAARLVAALFATFFCLAFLVRGEGGTAFALALALPWLMLVAAAGAARSWPTWSRWIGKLCARPWLRRLLGDEATIHALVPVAILLLVSLRVPSVAARSLLVVSPFALLLVARGLAALLPHPAVRTAGIALLLLASAVSIRQYSSAGVGSYDYQSLATAMHPLLRSQDVILINDAWWTQPMHYYLPPDRYRTGDFGVHIGWSSSTRRTCGHSRSCRRTCADTGRRSAWSCPEPTPSFWSGGPHLPGAAVDAAMDGYDARRGRQRGADGG
jgi:mannosyltransferase